jgi:hypothetical protein
MNTCVYFLKYRVPIFLTPATSTFFLAMGPGGLLHGDEKRSVVEADDSRLSSAEAKNAYSGRSA